VREKGYIGGRIGVRMTELCLVRVAARALVVKNGKILFVHHAPEDIPAHWETPGGGLGDGEDPRMAVLRELREETGAEGEITGEPVIVNVGRDELIELMKTLGNAEVPFDGTLQIYYPVRMKSGSGEQEKEHGELRFMAPEEALKETLIIDEPLLRMVLDGKIKLPK